MLLDLKVLIQSDLFQGGFGEDVIGVLLRHLLTSNVMLLPEGTNKNLGSARMSTAQSPFNHPLLKKHSGP